MNLQGIIKWGITKCCVALVMPSSVADRVSDPGYHRTDPRGSGGPLRRAPPSLVVL